jgi:hypothetical protein
MAAICLMSVTLPGGFPSDSTNIALVLFSISAAKLSGCRVVGLSVVGKLGTDAVLRQGVGQQFVGAAIQCTGRHDVVAGLGNGEHGAGDSRLARCHG